MDERALDREVFAAAAGLIGFWLAVTVLILSSHSAAVAASMPTSGSVAPATDPYTITDAKPPNTAVWHSTDITPTQSEPDFTASYKTGPPFVDTGNVLTYTIVAVNQGAAAPSVVLSDDLPYTAVFIPGSCTYRKGAGTAQPCGPLDQMWQEDFATGDRITTTFAVEVTAGSMVWPLVNCAYLDWDSGRWDMCFTTVVNPASIYLPLVMYNYKPPEPSLQLVAAPLSLEVGQTSVLTATLLDGGGSPIAGMAVDWATSDSLGSGALTPLNGSTDGNGQVGATLSSTVAGLVEVMAKAENGASDTISIQFTPSEFCAPELLAEAETGPEARQVALDTAGHRTFVAHAEGVTVIDTETYAAITEVTSLTSAHGIAYDPDRDRIWVTTRDGEGHVQVLDGATYAIVADLSAGDLPHAAAYNPTNGRVYVTNYGSDTVGVYDAASMTLERTLTGFREPAHVGVNPDTNKIYVANHQPPPNPDPPNDSVAMIDGGTHSITPIETSLIDAYGVAVDTTRNRIYVTAIAQGRFAIIDGATDTEMGRVDLLRGESAIPLRIIAVNPDVGTGGHEHLLLVTSSEDGGGDQLLLIPNNGWFDSGQPDLGDPVPLDIASYPQEGLTLNLDTDRAWVTSVADGSVSVVQDGEPVCSTSSTSANEDIDIEVTSTSSDK